MKYWKMRRNILMHEYFVQEREFLRNRVDLGIASKTVSATSLTTQTLKCFEICTCVSSERHQRNKCYLITCVSSERHQCLSAICYMRLSVEITVLICYMLICVSPTRHQCLYALWRWNACLSCTFIIYMI